LPVVVRLLLIACCSSSVVGKLVWLLVVEWRLSVFVECRHPPPLTNASTNQLTQEAAQSCWCVRAFVLVDVFWLAYAPVCVSVLFVMSRVDFHVDVLV